MVTSAALISFDTFLNLMLGAQGVLDSSTAVCWLTILYDTKSYYSA